MAWIKFKKRETLTDAEQNLVDFQILRYLNHMELAFNRFNDGLMPRKQWDMWSRTFAGWITESFSRELWIDTREDYGTEFAECCFASKVDPLDPGICI